MTARDLLRLVDEHPSPCIATELAELAGATVHRVGHLLDLLERRRLVGRHRDPARGTVWLAAHWGHDEPERLDELAELDRFMRANTSTL